MNNQAVIQLTEKVPLTLEALSLVIGFGHAKIAKHGKQIINTIWAFLKANDLLHLYPEVCLCYSGALYVVYVVWYDILDME